MSECKHVAFYLTDSKVFDSDGTEIGCTGGGLIKCTDCKTSVFDIQQENIQLKSDLQTLRERLKIIEIVVSHASYEEFCPGCNENPDSGKIVHRQDCWLKAELDKIGG